VADVESTLVGTIGRQIGQLRKGLNNLRRHNDSGRVRGQSREDALNLCISKLRNCPGTLERNS
jgi:hypothetical protein